MIFTRTPFVAGLLAGAVAGLGMLGLRSFVDSPSLQELIADRLLLFLSPKLFSFLLQQFWSLGKILSVAGITVLLALAGGLLGLIYAKLIARLPSTLAQRTLVTALGFALVLWLATNLALLPVLDVGTWGSDVAGNQRSLQAILLLGFGTYGWTLAVLLSGTFLSTEREKGRGIGIERRLFLMRSFSLALSVAAVASGLRFLVTAGAHGLSGLAKMRDDPGEMPSAITSVDDFYYVTKNLVDPEIAESSWRLSFDGLVDGAFALTLSDLRALPSVEEVVTLQCIENPVGGRLISTAVWKGVRLATLLQRAGLQRTAARIVFRAADGYEESLSPEEALHPEVIVAYEMNGAPLTREHGFPARMIIPGRYGMKSPKWLESISAVSDATFAGYWQKRGWDMDAFVKTTSQISVPRSLDPVVLGARTQAGGTAFAGDRGISRVEFSADGGTTWHEVDVSPSASPYSWALWTTALLVTDRTQRVLKVRAYDGTGTQQVEIDTEAPPAGATGLHTRNLYNIKDPG